MSDGAGFGLGAEQAMRTVLGADQPAEEDLMTVAEMREKLLTARPPEGTTKATGWTYDDAANYAARLILEYFLADPRRASIPTENEYEHDAEGHLVYDETRGLNVVTTGLYDVMSGDGIPIDDLGLSGFQWGWAVNAARRCVELPPVPNPALLTVNVEP